MVVSPPFLGGGIGFFSAEPEVHPDEIGKGQPEENRPGDDSEKVKIPSRIPTDTVSSHRHAPSSASSLKRLQLREYQSGSGYFPIPCAN